MGSFCCYISFTGYVYLQILSAGLHLYIIYSASKDIPQHDLKSQRLTLSKGVTHIPDKIMYKLMYPVKKHFQEGLFQFNGQFGIADIIGYHNCGSEDPHGSTRHLTNNAEFWRVFELQNLPKDRHYEPEERGLQCIMLSGEGKSLMDLQNTDEVMPSPSHLLECILHAIIGKYFSLHLTFYSYSPI